MTSHESYTRLHYPNGERTLCGRNIRNNIGVRVTKDATRITCARCHANLIAVTASEAAESIADKMIQAARMSDEPVVFVTGNSYMPPLRSYPEAEAIWQSDENADGELFAKLTEMLENILDDEHVYMDIPEWDNSIYVVDLTRFEHTDEDAETLNGEWRMYNSGTMQ